MKIGGRGVGVGSAPLVIAEMSGNHNQSLERAFEIVDAAAQSGAHALKIQTYTAETMTIDIREREFFISDEKSLWKGESLFDLYKKAYTPWEWHEAIFDRAKKHKMLAFSTPFDKTAVDFLENLNVPCYKIASFENTDLPLIRYVAATGKPMIISTGMATFVELDETVEAARAAGCKDLILLKCTSTYPSTPDDSNILTIPEMRSRYGCEIGISDHTMGVGVSVAAVALGATVIEKHFTLQRADGGVDSAFSMEPQEMAQLVIETERAWQAMGKVQHGPTVNEQASLVFRRSLYIVADVKAGEKLTPANVRAIRPGNGIAPKFYDEVIGKTAKRDIVRGTPLSHDLYA
ncbi:MAG: pseudaminic acid synthase [Actinobacteria bacterium]|nr:pseudaminic acid synthase [Actinomycetota bacterium]